MTRRFLFTLVAFVFCVSCFAEELPSVPKLIKRMYDYRMAIENMRAEVTVTFPVDTRQPVKEKIKEYYYFAYDKGRVRCDRTLSTPTSPQSQFYQYLSTPDFYFSRHTSPETQEVNDGNSLFVNPPLERSVETFDLRRLGTDRTHFVMEEPFNYEALLENFYSPMWDNFNVSIDDVDGEKIYKISCRFKDSDFSSSFWLDPQKGYNLVRSESGSATLDQHISYVVTLGKFTAHKGDMWFPKETFYRYKMGDIISEEKIVVDSVEFDVQDETPFTFTGLDIPIGYRVDYHGKLQYWDGKELVDEIPFVLEPVSMKSRKMFWIVNGIIFAILALLILYRYVQLRQRGNN